MGAISEDDQAYLDGLMEEMDPLVLKVEGLVAAATSVAK